MAEKEDKTKKFLEDPEVAIFDEIQDLGDKIDELKETLKKFDIAPLAELKKKYKIPVKGVDFFTPKDIEDIIKTTQSRIKVPGLDEIVTRALSRIRIPEDGYTPKKGKDYFDGENGTDGEHGKTPIKYIDYFTPQEQEELQEKIVRELNKLIPKPLSAKEIKEKIESLEGEERLDVSFLKGFEKYLQPQIIQAQVKNKERGIWQGSANPFSVIVNGQVAKDVRSITFIDVTMTNRNGDVIIDTSGSGLVTSVFGRTGAITAQSGDYTTAQVTESGNLYFTNGRAVTALTGQNISIFNNDLGYLTANQAITLSGDISGSGTTAITTAIGAGKVTNAMLAGSIANAKLLNSSITIGTTVIALGASSTTLAGLTSVTSTSFVGALTGNADTATKFATARTISITGDIAYTSPSFDGSGNVTAAATLATVNSNVGIFGSATQSHQITVNGKGLITAIANVTITPAVGSITGLGTGIATWLASPSSANLLAAQTDKTGTGLLVFGTSPTLTTAALGSSTATTQTPGDNSTKVATTAYVDAAILGQNFKEACRVATTANLVGVYLNGASGVGATFTYTATGADVIDGVTLALNDRVLLKNQTSDFQNGIYKVTTAGALGIAGVLTRATDANQSTEYETGDSVFITAGTTQSTTTWAYTGIDSPTMGTTSLTYAQVAGQGSFTAGNGIAITGNSIAIDTSVTVDKTTAQALTNKDLTGGGNTFPTFNQNTTGSAAKWNTARNLAGNSVDGSANVAFANKFIVQGTADAGLSAAQFMGALGTGIIKNTTTTGVFSIAVAGDFPTLNQSTTGSAATLTTPRTIWGQSFDGSAAISGSLTAVGNITGGASSMTILAGTGNSRTLTFQTTTSGGVATNGLVIDAAQHITLEGVTSTGATGTGKFVFDTAPTIVTPTFTTSVTGPLYIGGTGTTSTLTLRSTSNSGGTTGADIIFQSGNNGATETMRILNNGSVGIGTTAPNTALESVTSDATTGNGATFGQFPVLLRNKDNTLNNWRQIGFYGSDSNGLATIGVQLKDITNHYGDMVIGTRGSDGFNSRFSITSLGNVIVGTAALGTTATDGFFYIPSCAGIPTGVPTAQTGRVAMIYDSTNNNFYIYNGAWKKVALT